MFRHAYAIISLMSSWREIIQNTNQMKMKPALNFVAMLKKVFFWGGGVGGG